MLFAASENNPGWYLPEDDGTGGVAIQRRNMPLLKDNSSLFMLNQKTKVLYAWVVRVFVPCPSKAHYKARENFKGARPILLTRHRLFILEPSSFVRITGTEKCVDCFFFSDNFLAVLYQRVRFYGL